jgi:uncharacterized protein YndB with AHSA1/START domain
VSVAEVDVRVGGRFRVVFGGADGTEHECAGVYKEIVPHRKLVFTFSWPRTTPERVTLVTIEFRKLGKETELVFTHQGFFDEKVRDGHKQGWGSALESLAGYLADTRT